MHKKYHWYTTALCFLKF